MTIRTKLRLLALLPLILACIFGLVSYETGRQLNRALSKAQLAEQINKGLFELSLRTSQYMQNSSRQEHWWYQHDKLTSMFAQQTWTHRAEQMVIRSLIQHHRTTAALFRQAIRQHESSSDSEDLLSEDRAIRHLLDRTQVMVSQAYILQTISHSEVRDLQRRSTFVVGATLALIALAVIGLSVMLGRSILIPLQRLQKAAETVTAGEFGHQVEVSGNDEVSTLASAFNQMTTHVKNYYTALELEIGDRIQAEAALARHRDQLEDEVARRTSELRQANQDLQQEISARRAAQERTEQLNMMLTAIREVDHLMTTRRDRRELLQGACRVLRDICGHEAAWIVLVDEEGAIDLVEHVGAEPTPEGIIQTLRAAWPCQCAQLSMADGVIRLRTASDTECRGCAMHHLQEGKTSMTARVHYGDSCYGVISVTSPSAEVGDEEAQALFQELADDVALALHGYNLQHQRDQAEAERQRHLVELARSNEELQQFAYVASHDLQEPLRGIAGCLQLLEHRYHDQLDDLARQLIDHAVAGAERMRALIQDLLRYSRVGTRARPYQSVDMNAVLAEVKRDLQVAIEESQAVIDAGDLPPVEGDATQLSQLLQNLIGNAIKFHGEASPRITIRAHCEGNICHFSVQDNGIGIDARYSERIFVVFQRLHTRTEYPGTGMGLAICKKIVERHGGQIWLESQSGNGADFHFTLPAARQPVTSIDA